MFQKQPFLGQKPLLCVARKIQNLYLLGDKSIAVIDWMRTPKSLLSNHSSIFLYLTELHTAILGVLGFW
ncbi:hypothetical protein GXM_07219 [Nostoc sphaeroides CCNUC1]|uniref:Uncharacterized protein n=1 Tax=Nostoc sphaeroides CCNUC1 TaxID=2653204 RepID=A0A5P8WAA7_9NOSO|nr:hypothetical protein GXM_07219 [Nostoc sphaeroides CCNUC1]